MKQDQIARALGWFSIGLGLAELLAPRRLGRTVGMSDHETLLRVVGIREILSGVGILTEPRPTGWVRSRVAGDLMDLALLGAALMSSDSRRGRVAATTAAVAGVTAVDLWCSGQLARTKSDGRAQRIPQVRRSITINRPAHELFRFWRDFENLPKVMKHLVSVKVSDDNRSHWIAKGPLGAAVEWDAEIVQEEPDRLIAWRSLAGSDVENRGAVRFERATGARGTVVRVELEYRPPAGAFGARMANLFGTAPGQEIGVDLRAFKQLMETGEIATTEGQPAGRPVSISKKYDRAARNLAAA